MNPRKGKKKKEKNNQQKKHQLRHPSSQPVQSKPNSLDSKKKKRRKEKTLQKTELHRPPPFLSIAPIKVGRCKTIPRQKPRIMHCEKGKKRKGKPVGISYPRKRRNRNPIFEPLATERLTAMTGRNFFESQLTLYCVIISEAGSHAF